MRRRRSFVMILMVSSLGIFILAGLTIANIGLSEIIQTKARNDLVSGYYAAVSGAERMYAYLWSIDKQGSSYFTPGYTINTSFAVGGKTIPVVAQAFETTTANKLAIISTATAPSGRIARVGVTCAYSYSLKSGYPVGCGGDMTLNGHSVTIGSTTYTSQITAEGPIGCAGNLTTDEQVTVTPEGSASGGQSMSGAWFWLGNEFDTDNDGDYAVDTGMDGSVSRIEARDQGKEAEFNEDNKYPYGAPAADTDTVDSQDAFYHYYTGYYNLAANNPTGADLGIQQGGSNFISGDQSYNAISLFGNTLPQSKKIVFIDGDVDIVYNAQEWWGIKWFLFIPIPDDSKYAQELTIISMGNTTVAQPTNGSNDRITIVSYGDILSAGLSLSTLTDKLGFGDPDCNINLYSQGDIGMYLGGTTYGSMFCAGNLTVDTVFADADRLDVLNRDLNKASYKGNWNTYWPLGYPTEDMGYDVIEGPFELKSESDPGGKSIWQRL